MTLEDRVELLERLVDDLRERALKDGEKILELQNRMREVHPASYPDIAFPTPDPLEGWEVA